MKILCRSPQSRGFLDISSQEKTSKADIGLAGKIISDLEISHYPSGRAGRGHNGQNGLRILRKKIQQFAY